MAKDPKFFAVIDLETTGTEERVDPILEVGMLLTGPKFQLLGGYTWTVLPDTNRFILRRLLGNPTVYDMHRNSGLLDAVVYRGVPIGQAESEAIRVLESFGKPHEFMLAGSGVGHFDRRFLRAQMPDLEAWFQYPVMDVGVLRRFLQFSGRSDLVPAYNSEKPHRALEDARLHLQELQHYREALAVMAPPAAEGGSDG